MSNGLDALTRRREEAKAKRKGSMPPPMFKPRETPVEINPGDDESGNAEDATNEAVGGSEVDEARQAAEDARKADEARQAAEDARKADEARQAAEDARKADETRQAEDARKADEARKAKEEADRNAKEAPVDEPADIQIPAYITMTQDVFIQDVLREGRHAKPRITSQTAVIRYALRRLMEQQSPEQVVAAMQRHAVKVASTKSGPGRPRG
ncbi:hypothetical protein PP613_23230 [Mycobacteroides abscessus]|nr:hypothetical protein [Mycobacteroides abscessus]MDM2412256.1 hypothetical protein [Mycobacteroides abscessus]